MKKFLRRTIMFLLPIIIFGMVIGYLRYEKLLKLVNKGIKKIQTKSVFFVGDSHIEAIDVYDFDSSFVNIGQGGETMDVSIAKIKTLLSGNTSNPKNIYLGLSECNLVNNPVTAEEGKRMLFKFNLYLAKDKRTYSLSNPKDFSRYVVFDNYDKSGFGDGRGTFVNDAFRPEKVVNPEYSVMQFHYQDTNVNENTIVDKVTELNEYVKTRNAKLILINPPTTNLYKKYIPKTIVARYKSILNTLEKRGVEMLNYENVNFNDSLFHDMNHLNVNGSKTFLPLVFSRNKTTDQ